MSCTYYALFALGDIQCVGAFPTRAERNEFCGESGASPITAVDARLLANVQRRPCDAEHILFNGCLVPGVWYL